MDPHRHWNSTAVKRRLINETLYKPFPKTALNTLVSTRPFHSAPIGNCFSWLKVSTNQSAQKRCILKRGTRHFHIIGNKPMISTTLYETFKRCLQSNYSEKCGASVHSCLNNPSYVSTRYFQDIWSSSRERAPIFHYNSKCTVVAIWQFYKHLKLKSR